MRHETVLRYAILNVIAGKSDRAYGWGVKSELERQLGTFWEVGNGEIYRQLENLESAGWIEPVGVALGTNRKIFRITELGRTERDAFLLATPTPTPPPLRQPLDVKLLALQAEPDPRARRDKIAAVLRSIEDLCETHLQKLASLATHRRKLSRSPEDEYTILVIGRIELHLRAELTWLEEVAQLLRQHLAKVDGEEKDHDRA